MQVFVLGCEDGGYRFAFGVEQEDVVEVRLRVVVSDHLICPESMLAPSLPL